MSVLRVLWRLMQLPVVIEVTAREQERRRRRERPHPPGPVILDPAAPADRADGADSASGLWSPQPPQERAGQRHGQHRAGEH